MEDLHPKEVQEAVSSFIAGAKDAHETYVAAEQAGEQAGEQVGEQAGEQAGGQAGEQAKECLEWHAIHEWGLNGSG